MEAVTVHLGGNLGTLFGQEWKLFVSSPAEAFRAIDINTKGRFRRYLAEDEGKREYHVSLQKEDNCISAEELKNRSGKSDIYLFPVIKGRNNGWVKILAGAILVVVGAIIDYASGGTLAAWGGAFIGLGLSLILGGITQLLTPVPQQNQQLQSYNFQGNASTANQGGCVPLFYGRYLVTPVPICISFSASDLNNLTTNIIGGGGNGGNNGNNLGAPTTITLPGGGTQYVPADPSVVPTPTIPNDPIDNDYQF
jgi:predicted phage tail protein